MTTKFRGKETPFLLAPCWPDPVLLEESSPYQECFCILAMLVRYGACPLRIFDTYIGAFSFFEFWIAICELSGLAWVGLGWLASI